METNFIDPLTNLREWTVKKKIPRFSDNKLIFNNIWYSKDIKTRFISKNGGHYTLEAIWFVLMNQNEPFGNYFTKCTDKKIAMVSMFDYKPIIKFLNGDEVKDKLDNNLEIENLKDFWGITNDKRTNESEDSSSNKRLKGDNLDISSKEKNELSDKDHSMIKEHLKRENLVETRKTILLSKSKDVKKFKNLIEMVKIDMKNEEKLELKEKREKEEMEKSNKGELEAEASKLGIDMDGSFKSNDLKPKYSHSHSHSHSHSTPSQRSKPVGQIPIIIVPGGTNSLLNLYNAPQFFEDRVFVDPFVAQQKFGKKIAKNKFYRKIDGKSVVYDVYDNTKSFTSQDWERVVAVFSNAKDWQFKGWKIWKEDPTEIFYHTCGFYLKYEEDNILPEKIKSWNVTTLKISKNSRHSDHATVSEFWNIIDTQGAKKHPLLALNF